MANELVEKFMEHLKGLLNEPPYLLFVFIGAVFVLVSLLFQRNFYETWVFLLYSVAGTIWRYAERDILKNVLKSEWQKSASVVLYHLVNMLLFLFLLGYLNLI
jgi:hypothetical protein